MYPRLKAFRSDLQERGLGERPLYFAKVDVQSCFDSIPQNQLVEAVEKSLTVAQYRVGRHIEIKPPDRHQYRSSTLAATKLNTKFSMHAHAAGEFLPFEQQIHVELDGGRKNTIFVDSIVQHTESRGRVLKLLDEHVKRNIVKIGKKFYRQREGIPQGSVLSSLLCNIFYARFENECLGFARTEDSILLRLIDDFLLVSLDREQVERFLKVMHDGMTAYGIAVNPDKTLVNFDVEIDGRRLKEATNAAGFPYCGVLIDTANLSIGKDRERKATSSMLLLQDVGKCRRIN